jgi:hypothetical protein
MSIRAAVATSGTGLETRRAENHGFSLQAGKRIGTVAVPLLGVASRVLCSHKLYLTYRA